MDRPIDHRGLRRGLAVSVVLLGLLAGLLTVAASGALAQEAAEEVPPQRVYALTTSDQLLLFDGARPDRIIDTIRIKGLQRGESLVGVDFRPANGRLYGVGSKSNIYLVDEEDGSTRLVSTLKDADGKKIVLKGSKFGVDFNPVPDRLRIVSDTDQNLRANVDDGVTTVDGDLNYADGDENEGRDPKVTGVAYTNSTPPSPRTTPGTTLYDIDFGLDILAIQDPPNDGTLQTQGSLDVDAKALVGFDIVTVGATNRAFAALLPQDSKSSAFYGIDLESGEATRIGRIDGRKTKVEDIAIPISEA